MKRVWLTMAWFCVCAAMASCADATRDEDDSGQPDAGVADVGSGLRFGMLSQCLDWQAMPQPNFTDTLLEWSAGRCSPAGNGAFPFLVEGTCGNGGRVLYSGTGTTVERRFFDALGRFQAMQSGSDAGAPSCAVASSTPFSCGTATVARVVCGTALAVGAMIGY